MNIKTMQEIIKVVSLLNDEDQKNLLEFANILLKKDKYSALRKEIENRRSEIKNGDILSHEEIWQDI